MPKTTTKKTKKSPTRTKKAVKKTVKKTAAKKRVTKRTVKKVTKTAELPKVAMNPMDSLKKFFAVQRNVVILIAALVFLGAGYLLKDVFIVAMVNGKPIYRWTVIQRLEEQGGRQVLDSIITEKLVEQAVKASGVEVEQEEIDLAVKEIEDRIAAQGLTLEKALEEQGMTRDDLVKDIVLQRSAEKIVADRVEITEAEVDAYVEENSEFFPEGTDMEGMKELIREQLKSAKVNEEIAIWVQEIQDEAKIIYTKDYELEL